MHTLAIQTKFIFGDVVRFDSRLQQRRGDGTIVAITVDAEMHIEYMIAVDGDSDLQPGIQDHEITLVKSRSE